MRMQFVITSTKVLAEINSMLQFQLRRTRTKMFKSFNKSNARNTELFKDTMPPADIIFEENSHGNRESSSDSSLVAESPDA